MITTRITCVMPFYNEARHLPAVLASLETQTLPRERLYFIGVDNGSVDGSQALFEEWLARAGYDGRLLRATVRSIPFALNTGLREVAGNDIVVRLDAHTVYASDYLATIDEAFSTLPEDVWCVGGAPTPHLGATNYGRALGIALYSNPLGLGPADYRSAQTTSREVSTVYLGAWRPGVFARLGLFDERWEANEDCEFTERIRANGGRIFRIPVQSGRIVTRGPVGNIRQWARYGFWRMQTFKQYPQAVRPRHVAAPVALLVALGLALSRGRPLLAPLYALYALMMVRCRRRGEPLAVTLGSLAFFPLVHIGYALGLIVGLLRTPGSLGADPSTRARRRPPRARAGEA